jgi:hypothetical protein
MSKARKPAPRSFVEFVYRVHSDGRRERSAAVFVVDEDGRVVPGPVRPTGPLGEFVADAVSEVASGSFRRVRIDARGEEPRGRRGRGERG